MPAMKRELRPGITLIARRKREGGRLVQCYTFDCRHGVQELTSRPVVGGQPVMSANAVLFRLLFVPQDCGCVRRAWQRGRRGWEPLLAPLKRELREVALPKRRWMPVAGDEAVEARIAA